jgi:hypothetical protein
MGLAFAPPPNIPLTISHRQCAARPSCVETGDIDHTRLPGIFPRHGPYRVGEALAQVGCDRCNGRPVGLLGDVQADKLVILFEKHRRHPATPELAGEVLDLIVEYVGELLQEDEWLNVVFKLGRIHRAADHTRGPHSHDSSAETFRCAPIKSSDA